MMYQRLILALTVLLAAGCNVTQYLPEDEFLYRGASLQIESPDSVATTQLNTELTAILDQNTNAKIPLIGYRDVWSYYKFEEKKREDPAKYAEDPNETKGEEPIFFKESNAESVGTLLQNRAANNGYFNNESRFTVDTNFQAREVTVNYTVSVAAPYMIDTVTHYLRDTAVARIVDEVQSDSYLKHGMRYDLDAIKNERLRWQRAMRDAGYFYASSNDFLFLADTVAGDHQVAMLAKLKEDIPPENLRPQRISQINVYPNFDVADTNRLSSLPLFQVGDINVRCEDCPLRPKIVDEAFAMEVGELYNPENHRKTLRRLASYNMFRYISMDYEEETTGDSSLVLNAYMDPLPRRRIEGELGLTYNSAQYFGPNVRLAYTNRNLLRGAELLRIEGDFSYASFLGNADEIRVPNSGIYGLSATLNVPRLWLPGRKKLLPRVMTSGTVITLGAKLESLSLTLAKFQSEINSLRLNSLSQLIEEDPEASESVRLLQILAQYGYTWQRRIKKTHQLNPLSVRFQDPVVSNGEVLEIARNLGLAPNSGGNSNAASRFDRMIVFSPNYTLTYDSRLKELKTHNFFWRQYLSMNWNNIFPVGMSGTSERISSIYPQVESDIRYYLTLARGSQIAMRIHGGVAYPISDRAIVPYFDLYTIGGPNSLRGFVPRQLGPGKTAPVNNNLLTFGGYGNLLLETSLEYRHRVTSLIELAAFFDAGNIWTYKTEAEPLDTDFRRNDFINELAMNYGVGFRFDLQFLIFRLDLAKPFQIPYDGAFAETVFPLEAIGDAPDRSLKIVIAFGYPF